MIFRFFLRSACFVESVKDRMILNFSENDRKEAAKHAIIFFKFIIEELRKNMTDKMPRFRFTKS